MRFSSDDSSSVQDDSTRPIPLPNLNDEIKAGESKIKVFSFEPSPVSQNDADKSVRMWQCLESSGVKPMRGQNMSSSRLSISEDSGDDLPTVVTWGDALEMLRQYGLDKLAVPGKNRSMDCKMCKHENDHKDHFESDDFDIKQLNSYNPQRVVRRTIGIMTDEIVMKDKAIATDLMTDAEIAADLIAKKEDEIDDLFKQLSAHYSTSKPCKISGNECVCFDCDAIEPYQQRSALLGPPPRMDADICSCGEANCMCSHIEAVLQAIDEANFRLEYERGAASCDCLECFKVMQKVRFDLKMVLEGKVGKLDTPERHECSCNERNCPCEVLNKLHADIDAIMKAEKKTCTCGQAKCVCVAAEAAPKEIGSSDGLCNCLECYKELFRAWFDLKIALEDKLGPAAISGVPTNRNCTCLLKNCACGVLNNIHREMDRIMKDPSKVVCSCGQANCDCKFRKLKIPGCTCLDCYKQLLKAMFDLKIVLVDKVGTVLGMPEWRKCSCKEPGCPCSILNTIHNDVNEIIKSEESICTCGKTKCDCKLKLTKLKSPSVVATKKTVEECKCLDCYKELLRAWFDLRMHYDDGMDVGGVLGLSASCKCACTQPDCPCNALNMIHGEIDKILKESPKLVVCKCGKPNCKCLISKTEQKCVCEECSCLECYSELLKTWLDYQLVLQGDGDAGKIELNPRVLCECSCRQNNCACSILKDIHRDVEGTNKPTTVCNCDKDDRQTGTINICNMKGCVYNRKPITTNLAERCLIDNQYCDMEGCVYNRKRIATNLSEKCLIDTHICNLEGCTYKKEQVTTNLAKKCLIDRHNITKPERSIKVTTRSPGRKSPVKNKTHNQFETVEEIKLDTSIIAGEQFRNFNMPSGKSHVSTTAKVVQKIRDDTTGCRCKVIRPKRPKKPEICTNCECKTQPITPVVEDQKMVDDKQTCGLVCTCGCLDEDVQIEGNVRPPSINGAESRIKVLLKRGCTKPKSC